MRLTKRITLNHQVDSMLQFSQVMIIYPQKIVAAFERRQL
jgi:hypothetical protein